MLGEKNGGRQGATGRESNGENVAYSKMAEKNTLAVIFAGAAVIPAISYDKGGMNGLLLGSVLAIVIQAAALKLWVNYWKKHNSGLIPTFADIMVIISLGLAVGTISLGYVAWKKNGTIAATLTGAVLGFLLTLVVEDIGVRIGNDISK